MNKDSAELSFQFAAFHKRGSKDHDRGWRTARRCEPGAAGLWESRSPRGTGPRSRRCSTLAAQAVFTLLLAACVPIYAQTAPDLVWPEHPRLSWDDFKAQPPQGVTYPSAESETGFKYQLLCSAGKLDVDAHAFFSPSGSWVIPPKKNPELLKHEQGHFDMAEVYALKLKKAIRDANISCDDPAKANALGQKMAGEFQADWENAEREYEQDTQYGTDLAKQNAASNKIARELAALNAYQR
jgi:hypothetical protein